MCVFPLRDHKIAAGTSRSPTQELFLTSLLPKGPPRTITRRSLGEKVAQGVTQLPSVLVTLPSVILLMSECGL